MVLRFETAGVLIVLAISVSAGLSTAQAAGTVERGKLLYETRCVACHESSVHNRAARKAKSFNTLRAQVQRWSQEVGGSWRESEIDDISLYLNQSFYRFPCPQRLCKVDRVSINN